MQFILSDLANAEQALRDYLLDKLKQGKKVLWLLSGGSNITSATKIMAAIPDDASSHLTIALIDERYGPVGHPDSNWQQLKEAGLGLKRAQYIPCLQPDASHQETAQNYDKRIRTAFSDTDTAVGLLGMGADGHIAGILPRSAATQPTAKLVTAYDGPDHRRITLTYTALKRLTSTYVFAYGSSKRLALTKLRDQDVFIEDQPAQFLKQQAEVYLYNDQLGDNI